MENLLFTVDTEALLRLPPEQREKAEQALREIGYKRQNDPLAFYRPHAKQKAFHSFTAHAKCFFGGNQAQPMTEWVLTPAGWRHIGFLKPGDLVIAGDGSVVPVIGVYPQGQREVFRLTFDDGAFAHCTEDHLWRIKDGEARFRKTSSRYGEWSVVDLGEIRERWGDTPIAKQRIAIPVCEPDLPSRLLPLDPYLLGVLLGDGGLTQDGVRLTSADQEIVSSLAPALPEGVRVRHVAGYDYALTTGNRGGRPNPLTDALRDLRVKGCNSHSKFIPPEYLNADRESRLAVLQGLLDTDGSVSREGHIEFGTVSPMLAWGVANLVRCLGGKAKVAERRASFRVHVRLPHLPPFRLKRKLERCFRPTSTCDERILHSIEAVRTEECVCIKVAHPDGTYVTRDGIVTHNSGKTTAGLADDIIQAIDEDAVPEHLKPYKKFKPPFLCRIMAESFPVLETTLLQKLQELLPADQLLGGSWAKAYDKNLRVLYFANGSKFFFMTYEQEVRKMGGASIDRVHFDEEPPLAVFNECRLRVMAHGGDLLFTMTPVFGLTWTFDQLWRRRGDQVEKDVYRAPDIDVVTVDIKDNPTIDHRQIELALEGMSDEERAAREKGHFVALHGLIYADFKRDLHVTPERPIPDNVNVVVGIDPGMRYAAAVVWIYLTPDDTMVVFHESYHQGQSARQVCQTIHETNAALDVHPLYYVIDPAARNKEHQTGRSTQMEYADNGIVTILGQHAVTAGINRVRERFQKERLYIQANCTQLIDELQKYRWKRPPRTGEDGKEAPVKKEDHGLDALRYAVMSRPYLPEVQIEKQETQLERLMREDQNRFTQSNDINIGLFSGIAP